MAASREMAATPICRCRVLYLGSAVPHVTKDGLQGIQEPLRELYPEAGALGAKGIDSWLSVWSNGLLLENVDENQRRVTRFFPIESLHYCAAVRYVLVPAASGVSSAAAGAAPPPSASAGVVVDKMARFLPLDSPFARQPNIHHPPLFACIMRRTTGIKVSIGAPTPPFSFSNCVYCFLLPFFLSIQHTSFPCRNELIAPFFPRLDFLFFFGPDVVLAFLSLFCCKFFAVSTSYHVPPMYLKMIKILAAS